MTEHATAADFWEDRYGGAERVWSGKVNASTADAVAGLAPGDALDLGCGEGGDALWLAERGWAVTGVDISPTAVARARAEAAARGLDGARFEAVDLATWEPSGPVDLVTASFLHSPVTFPRDAVLRRASGWVRPGGRLVIVSHAAPPPWSTRLHEHRADLVGAADQVASLALGDGWVIERAEDVARAAVGPDGQEAELLDAVVVAARAASAR